MLIPVDDGAAVVACSSCRFSAGAQGDAEGRRGGARLIDALLTAKAGDDAYAGIAVQPMPCLFACGDFCVVHLRAPGKIGYVLGRFSPDGEAARAIMDYAVLHAASENGEVAYRRWPEGVKGHFIVRIPPAGFVAK